MTKIIYIYGLFDSITGELRYIGKTNNPDRRLKEHVMTAKYRPNAYRDWWIKSLLKKGGTPIIKVIEKCDNKNWEEKEIKWIGKFNTNLTNLTKGGEGGLSGQLHPFYGGNISDNHKKNMSIAARNKPPISDITRKRMSMAQLKRQGSGPNKGKKFSESWRENIRKGAKKIKKTEEWNKKNKLAVSMMWAKRKNNISKIYNLQEAYFGWFGEYNHKYLIKTSDVRGY